MTAEQLIAALGLKPHPQEGGWFCETYRSAEELAAPVLPPRYGRDKATCTAMYYLLTPDTYSALHRLPTDEIFHFYLGDPVDQLQLLPDGTGRVLTLGNDVLAGHCPQLLVPRDVWQGSRLQAGGRFALLGTTMAPGFDPDDYEAGHGEPLARAYPAFANLIHRLTR